MIMFIHLYIVYGCFITNKLIINKTSGLQNLKYYHLACCRKHLQDLG